MRFFVYKAGYWRGVENLQWHYKVLAFHSESVNDHNSQQLNPCVAPMKTSFAVSNTRRLRGGNKGFSLVEVTIALGVAAFALVAIFGMLPTGLNLFRSSMDRSIKAQIAQHVASELNQTDFTNLTDTEQTPPISYKYFSEDAEEVPQPQSIYTAKVTVTPNPVLPRDGQGDSGLKTNPTLVRLDIRVARNPAHQDSLLDDQANGSTKPGVDSFVSFIARNQSLVEQ